MAKYQESAANLLPAKRSKVPAGVPKSLIAGLEAAGKELDVTGTKGAKAYLEDETGRPHQLGDVVLNVIRRAIFANPGADAVSRLLLSFHGIAWPVYRRALGEQQPSSGGVPPNPAALAGKIVAELNPIRRVFFEGAGVDKKVTRTAREPYSRLDDVTVRVKEAGRTASAPRKESYPAKPGPSESDEKNGTQPNEKNGTQPNEKNGTQPNEKNGTQPNEKNGTQPNEQDDTQPNEQDDTQPDDQKGARS